MEDPRDKQNRRLMRIILISWFAGLLIAIAGVTYATVEIAKIKQNYAELASRPAEIVKTDTIQLQPIYTTIDGRQGPKGDKGEDSLSTHTETVIKTETAIPGPTGKSGKNGLNGREIELAQDSQGNLYQRYTGDENWTPITVITGLRP